MLPIPRRTVLLILGCVVPCAGIPGVARADEFWVVPTGTTTIEFDADALDRLGISVGDPEVGTAAWFDQDSSWVLAFGEGSDLSFVVRGGSLERLDLVRLVHEESLTIATPDRVLGLTSPTVGAIQGDDLGRFRLAGVAAGDDEGLVLERYKAGFDGARGVFTIHFASVYLTPKWATALGHPEWAQQSLGSLTIQGAAVWTGGEVPLRFDPESSAEAPLGVIGPDMTFCQLYGLAQYGRLGDIVGLTIATTSWNTGDEDLMWFNIPDEEHPFIVMNMFRLKNDRFEQIGQSWIKHGFYALGNRQCGGSCTYEQGHGQGNWLGMGCTDTYSAGLNASQSGLGPRYEVDPWSGIWNYPGSHNSQGNHSHNAIEHRLQVYDADLNPAQNAGATYYGEGYYAVLDDVNVMNSASWKPTTVSGAPGGTWSFGMSGAATFPNIGFAIDAWDGALQTVIAQEVPPIEFVSPDGRCVLAAKATVLPNDNWHYEYALLNVDMDRQVGSFTVPMLAGTDVTNVGFHAVHHHNEPLNAPGGVPIDNALWTWQVNGLSVTWSTTSNPIRWGTLYNFRFDADSAPGDVTAVLGMFKPGTPATVEGMTVGPINLIVVCGDGDVEGNEACDPPDGQHCDEQCQWICGDGEIQEGEECDPPNGITCDEQCQRIPICGDTIIDIGEQCDPPDGEHCDDQCQWICGDGVVQAGEDCDPPNGVSCDDDCQRIPWCGDGYLDPGEECDDGNNDPGDGCDADCIAEWNDDCADAIAVSEGAYPFDTTGATTDGPNEPGACDFKGYTQVGSDIWFRYTASCSGEATVSLCPSQFDTKVAIYDGVACPSTPSAIACNDDDNCLFSSRVSFTVVLGSEYFIRVGGYLGATGTGTMAISCDGLATDPVRGGLLWDEWWKVNNADEPAGDHPLYPPEGQKSGSTTFRCKECHGWDYKGVDGAYGSGSHYTGIGGVYESEMTPQEMFDLIKLSPGPNGHGFGDYGLNDQDIWDLVAFLQLLAIDTDNYIDPSGQFSGDPTWGQVYYEFEGAVACIECHGFDGTAINFGTFENPEWVGTIADANPWEMLHKTRFGQPGTPMPSWLDFGGTDQRAADIGRYAQDVFPVDCLDDVHCDDGDWCNGTESCDGRFCQDGTPPPAEIDCNLNSVDDRCDPFADFDDNEVIDLSDYAAFNACMTEPCGNPPCDPTLYLDPCCVIADSDDDGDVDMDDFSEFQPSLGQLLFRLRDDRGNVVRVDTTDP